MSKYQKRHSNQNKNDTRPNLTHKSVDQFERAHGERTKFRDQISPHTFDHKKKRKQKHSGLSNAGGSKPDREQNTLPNSNQASSKQSSNLDNVLSLVTVLCRPKCNITKTLDAVNFLGMEKSFTVLLSTLAKRQRFDVASCVWKWMEQKSDLELNVFHYNSMIHVFGKAQNWKSAMNLLDQMDREGVKKNDITFVSAISACKNSGMWEKALALFETMKNEGSQRTVVVYNAVISACEKGLDAGKAINIFAQMKREGVKPDVVTYSSLISACEKGKEWKLALDILEEMKTQEHGVDPIAYSAAIAACSKCRQWEKALSLFREMEQSFGQPNVIMYNTTMTALERGLQWEKALDLFDEMKSRKLQPSVVSYGCAIVACEKGYQWKKCLTLLDEMTEQNIEKNVIIFGAVMSCLEKCNKPDIALQILKKMRTEGIRSNVHIYNSVILAHAKLTLWKKSLDLFYEMDQEGVQKDVVTYNAVLDSLSGHIKLAQQIFREGIEKGFYSKVAKLRTEWVELDLHFLSLGAGEAAVIWLFQECLAPYLQDRNKLLALKSIDIITGYGKSRWRGDREGNDGMGKRARKLLQFMNFNEIQQSNPGRVKVDMRSLISEVKRCGGKIVFDSKKYEKIRKKDNTSSSTSHGMKQEVKFSSGKTDKDHLTFDKKKKDGNATSEASSQKSQTQHAQNKIRKVHERSPNYNGDDNHKDKKKRKKSQTIIHGKEGIERQIQSNQPGLQKNNQSKRKKLYHRRNPVQINVPNFPKAK